eukprot:875817-Rhodomonas_salina.4
MSLVEQLELQRGSENYCVSLQRAIPSNAPSRSSSNPVMLVSAGSNPRISRGGSISTTPQPKCGPGGPKLGGGCSIASMYANLE